ncbi:DNA methylase N-4/N-6 domain protein [Ancylobacter novellus DSM 506]|uniref:Methyltransferase n=1 Tax=Ancylobacter novellus (strain ATCC 8093 / DSM 506 / JCM 20403 / CCM 1077 / IAM 12100 / NBRC 12443 / NCIMB 10456) TaxID=639283 RepID=D7A2P3_ANCN5|nr:DNA methyltransferase [Ancylobacter novellus]ADH91573.1 DNA methylase N-4/N-6 domain protein [Ancylobacter novellus DSM 506]
MSCNPPVQPAVASIVSNAPIVPEEYRNLELLIRCIPIEHIKSYEHNPRTHSKHQIDLIFDSIRTFGFVSPVTIANDGTLIAGHARVIAAKSLGYTSIPAICLSHLTQAEQRALRIADNKIAERAGWNDKFLAEEFAFLTTDLSVDFDVAVTGFENPEIDGLIAGLDDDEASADERDVVPEVSWGSPVSQFGDRFDLDEHSIICGDSTDSGTFGELMGDERATVVSSDGPYNVAINGHVSSTGRHREFVAGVGEMDADAFTAFNASYLNNCLAYSVPGVLIYAFMDWRHMEEVLSAGRLAKLDLQNLCVWNKGSGGMGSFYRSQHELVFVFKEPSASHVNNVKLGKFGRNRTNVWNYPGASSLRKELELHPTPKPVALVADIIRDASNRGDVVLDPFSGSGTTIIAAASTGRRARVIELDPHYVDVAVRRWEEWSGGVARHSATGLTFAELAQRRRLSKERAAPKATRIRVRRSTTLIGEE